MKWLIAILIFGIIILIHEYGHFLAAKMNGVEVTEFSIGFGPRLVSTVKNGTRYSLKALPFGGSCAMKGLLDDGETDLHGEGSFLSKPVGSRMSIVLAGPFFNFLLAFFAAVILISVVGYDPTTVTYVDEEAPCAEAGLIPGDRILSINGSRCVIGGDVDAYFTFHPVSEGQELEVGIERNGEKKILSFPVRTEHRYMMGISYNADDSAAELSLVQTGSAAEEAGLFAGDVVRAVDGTAVGSGRELSEYMQENPPDGSAIRITVERNGRSVEAIVYPVMTAYATPGFASYAPREKVGAAGVLRYSLTEIRYWISVVIRSIGMLFNGQAGLRDLSGPVGVVNVISDTYEETKSEGALILAMNMLHLLILLSANIGVMNLLPIPALDGGRFLLLIAEGITGKPLNPKVETAITFAGTLLLILLMVFVLFQDVTRLFR